MALKIRLKPREKMVVNGAVISAGEQGVVLYFLNSARILMEKDILTESRVVGPESRLYFILQLMYIDPADQARYAQHLTQVVEETLGAHPNSADDIELILELAAKGDFFKAMRHTKKCFHIDSGPSHEGDDEDDDRE